MITKLLRPILLYIIALVALSISTFYAQAPSGITIDWTKTTNTASGSNKFSLKPNFFNWQANAYDINNPQYQWNDAISPYYNTNNPVQSIVEIANAKDMKPEDGWELIHENTGFQWDENGNRTTRSNADVDGHPSFVMYNKYSSVLRVFVLTPSQFGTLVPYARFNLTITDGLRGNVIYESTKDSPIISLDNIQNGTDVSSVTEFPNDARQWYYADFHVHYDPCQCLHKSQISISVKLIQRADVTLSGKITGTLVSLENNSGSINPLSSSFSFSTLAQTIGKVGMIGYKTYKDANSASNFEIGHAQSLENAGVMTSQQTQSFEDSWLGTSSGSGQSQTMGMRNIMKSAFFLKNGIAKGFPYLATAMSLTDYFLLGGKKAQSGTNPVFLSPTSLNAEVFLNGAIEISANRARVTFGMPGGTNNEEYERKDQPNYNNPLGVFALLNAPKVKGLMQYQPLQEQDAPYRYFWGIKVRAKLSEDIKYVVNPAAGLYYENQGDVEILGALVFEFQDNQQLQEYNDYNANLNTTFIVDETKRQYRTQYLPIACLKDLDIGFSVVDHLDNGIDIPKVFLKLMVNLKRKDANATTQNVLYVGKYPISGQTFDDINNFNNAFWQLPNEVVLNSSNINSDQVAWKKITIQQGTTFGSNPIVIRAGEDIIVESNVTLPSNVRLEIGNPTACSSYPPLVTPSEISSFCGNNAPGGYRPEMRNAKLVEEYDNLKSGNSEIPNQIHGSIPDLLFDAYPNPFGTQTTLRYSIGQAGKVELYVTDALGQRIATLVDTQQQGRGVYDVSFGNNDLPAGVYYYTLRTDTFTQTKKVVLLR